MLSLSLWPQSTLSIFSVHLIGPSTSASIQNYQSSRPRRVWIWDILHTDPGISYPEPSSVSTSFLRAESVTPMLGIEQIH
jgi:hypothetical protein